jgi:hypothetical protein
VFVFGKFFQPSLMFAGKAGAYSNEVLFQVLRNKVGSWPHPQTLDWDEKACQVQTL